MAGFTPGRRLFLDKDGKVVEATDPTKATLLCTETGTIPLTQAKALGLVDDEPKAEVKAEAPKENKALAKAPSNKAAAKE